MYFVITGATRSAPKAETRAETKIQDKYTRGTSPIQLESEQVDSAPSTPRLIDAATSYSKRLDRSIEEVVEDGILNTPTRKMDAATSYSRRLDRSIEEVVEDGILNTPTRKMDAATSYSRRSPRYVYMMNIFYSYIAVLWCHQCHRVNRCVNVSQHLGSQ